MQKTGYIRRMIGDNTVINHFPFHSFRRSSRLNVRTSQLNNFSDCREFTLLKYHRRFVVDRGTRNDLHTRYQSTVYLDSRSRRFVACTLIIASTLLSRRHAPDEPINRLQYLSFQLIITHERQ